MLVLLHEKVSLQGKEGDYEIMCKLCRNKTEYYVNHVDEIIAESNRKVEKIIRSIYILSTWKRFLIWAWPGMFSQKKEDMK